MTERTFAQGDLHHASGREIVKIAQGKTRGKGAEVKVRFASAVKGKIVYSEAEWVPTEKVFDKIVRASERKELLDALINEEEGIALGDLPPRKFKFVKPNAAGNYYD